MTETIGQRIRRFRLAKNMTQVQLAQAIRIRAESVSRLENDRFRPTPRTVSQLADALGVSEDQLKASND
jgi:transcriptional regulator with XRE-family HTH domain